MLVGAIGEDTSSGTVPTGSLASKSTATPSDNNLEPPWRNKAQDHVLTIDLDAESLSNSYAAKECSQKKKREVKARDKLAKSRDGLVHMHATAV